MKNRFLQFAAVIFLVVLSLSVSAASGSRSFNEYTITPVEQTELSAGVDKAWLLAYGSDESPIQISYIQGKYCKTFIVRGDHFELVYECTKKGFGARLVKDSEGIFPEQLTEAVLNSDELKRQRILTAGPVSDERALGLIAAYLPDLINPAYQHLLN